MSTTARETDAPFDPSHPALGRRVMILNGFSDTEIMEIMRQVKSLCRGSAEPPAIDAARQDLIFAKTTPASLEARLGALIIDMAGDHDYLQKNPPKAREA